MVQPELSAGNRASFEEEIGVDPDSEELQALESSDLCKARPAVRFCGNKPSNAQSSKSNAMDRQTDSAVSTPRVAIKRKRE
jgi:hypothetical protein